MSETRTREMLKQMQSLPLDMKISLTKSRIREWVREFGENGVYVSFSGGKDSTVLLHLVREMYPNVEAVFCNTGLEFPKIQNFAKSFENVTVIRPEKSFVEVIKEYGYPMISKEISRKVSDYKRGVKWVRLEKYRNSVRFNYTKYIPICDWCDFNISDKCCNYLKKNPIHKYAKLTGKKAITAQMADESAMREKQWIDN